MDTLALYDSLDADERAALDAAMADKPELATALQRWRQLRAGVRADLAQSVPDRTLLVLYALSDADDVLTPDERETLEAARPDLEAALEKHPGLTAVVKRIRDDRDAFDAAWNSIDGESDAAPDDVRPLDAAWENAGARRIRSVGAGRAEDRAAAPRVRTSSGQPMRWAFRVAALVAVVGFGTLVTWLGIRDAGLETLSGAQTVAFADGTTAVLDGRAVLEVGEDRGREARLVAGR
ncbi:MAG: hypothetical protein WBA11_01465, partial [Rubrivirga sp.]